MKLMINMQLGLFCLLVVSVSTQDDEGTIVSSLLKWHFIGEDYFVNFNDISMTWLEGQDFCRKFGLEVYQPRNLSAVAHYLADNFDRENVDEQYHVGGRDNGTHYLWLSGEIVSREELWYSDFNYGAVGGGCLSITTHPLKIKENEILIGNYGSCQHIQYLNHPLCGEAPSYSLEWHSVSSDRFVRYNRRMNWDESRSMCKIHGLDLYEPQDPVAVVEYLGYNLKDDVSLWYWLGARGNNTDVVWISGEVIDENSPLWLTYGAVNPWNKPYSNYCLKSYGDVTDGTKMMFTSSCSERNAFPLCG